MLTSFELMDAAIWWTTQRARDVASTRPMQARGAFEFARDAAQAATVHSCRCVLATSISQMDQHAAVLRAFSVVELWL